MDHGGHDASPARCNMNMLFTWSTRDLCIIFRSWHITGPITLTLSLLARCLPRALQYEHALHLVDTRPLHHLPQLAYHRPYNTHTLPPRYRRSRRWFRGAARYNGEVRCFAVEAEGGITSTATSYIEGSAARKGGEERAVWGADVLCVYDYAAVYDIQRTGDDCRWNWGFCGTPGIWRLYDSDERDCLPLNGRKERADEGNEKEGAYG
ncbi:hypothetical protein O988_00113 [Pseudogymnoascus sp. VKM F-3808]|nr:hypothetical protein O988_00113 [Pseudogymnoascus sp. VKM F-3808]